MYKSTPMPSPLFRLHNHTEASSPSIFQPRMASVRCLMSLSFKSKWVSKILVEVQSKLHRRAFVKFVMRFLPKATYISRCWARMSGHGSSSVSWLWSKKMYVNDVRFADSSKTRGSIDDMMLFLNDSDVIWRRLTNTPSCSSSKQQQIEQNTVWDGGLRPRCRRLPNSTKHSRRFLFCQFALYYVK